jgi:menaquinone-9 beta-reductase
VTDDVLVVGAGPAGAIAALTLARAGVRVRIIDRTTFPRDKPCGDTLNPGAMALLARLGLAAPVIARGLPVDGMLVTGPGAAVRSTYGRGLTGRALVRRDLDEMLVEAAVTAGARLETGIAARDPIREGPAGDERVTGVMAGPRGGRPMPLHARLVIAADGRRSRLALGLGLIRHPPQPRRWAMAAYFEGVQGLSSYGEMHIRRRHYIGVAPVPGGLANACAVVTADWLRDTPGLPGESLQHVLHADARLGPRFAGARRASPVSVLGPLAVDASGVGVPGLLLAGDAAGFIDPMTGDGLRGGELAAEAALAWLANAATVPHERLAALRAREFGAKWRVNRALRRLVASPGAVVAAAAAVRVAPGLLPPLIRFAGDVNAG